MLVLTSYSENITDQFLCVILQYMYFDIDTYLNESKSFENNNAVDFSMFLEMLQKQILVRVGSDVSNKNSSVL